MLRALLALVLALFLTPPAAAQLMPGLGSTAAVEPEAESGLDEALRRAREAGVGVIIVDTEGRVLNDGAPAEPEPEAAPDGSMSTLMEVQRQRDALSQTLGERLDALPGSIEQLAFVLRSTSPDGRIMTYVEAVLRAVFVLFLGTLFTRFVYGPYMVRNMVVSRIREAPDGYREKMPFLLYRFVMGVLGTIVAMIVSVLIVFILFETTQDETVQTTILAVYTAYFAAFFVGDLWRMILSPYLAQYRIPAFTDADARKLYLWLFFVTMFGILVDVFATWLSDFGLIYNAYAVIYAILSLLAALLNIVLVLANRRAISGAIRNGRKAGDVPLAVRLVARLWAPAVIVYMIFGWGNLAADLLLEQPLSIPLIAGLYAVLLSMVVVYGLINYGLESYFERARRIAELNAAADTEGAEDSEADPQGALHDAAEPLHVPPAMDTYEGLARRVSGILAFIAGAYALIAIWGGASDMMAGDWWGTRAIDLAAIAFIGWIAYHAFRIWIDGKIAEEVGDAGDVEPGDEGGASSASRLATLLPLFRAFVLIVIVVTVILIILLELGVNVSPLFAGAGIVGVAVGFGSQALVRDIFSGAFFLFDDAFRKGEYIDTGGVKGTVEKISVRSFQLRHHLGPIHTIPFGEIQVLTNYSRDWVVMKLPLRVTYDTDVDKVRKLIKKLGQEMLEDPEIGQDFIQPLKSQGVIEMQDSAMIIRVKFMTKPGDQWIIRKKVYQEIRALFEREGIKFAHREVTVRIADENKDMPEAKKQAAIAAAQAGIDDDLIEGGVGDGGDDR
ncbi:MAG: mechanosensitive ion channel family protein [Pseudomonadota bacterium]